MIKKIFSILLIMAILFILSMNVFCNVGQPDGYFKSITVKEIDKPEVPEIATWSATKPNVQFSVITINELNYEIKYMGKNIKGTLEKVEGKKTIKVTYSFMGKEQSTDFIFNVTKTITQKHVDATYKYVKYVDSFIYTKGEFKGKQVKFYPDTKILWKDRDNYYKEHAPFLTADPTPSLSTSVESSVSPSVNQIETSSTPVVNNKTLPKTGETENDILLICGFAVLAIGAIAGMSYKILGNKKVN